LRSVPFSDSELNLATFITTEKLFTELTGASRYQAIDIQLNRGNQEKTVKDIRNLLAKNVIFLDQRQNNAEINQTFFTMAVFVYGFVAVIALISILNIINTMNTSVAAKTRYLGVMRAIGMSGDQMNKMLMAEAATYSLIGCLTGCTLGVILQRFMIKNLLTSFHMNWHIPLIQIIFIVIITLFVTVLSIISPLKRIKAGSISEVIGSL
jgi:putative ABC transport system permease protein